MGEVIDVDGAWMLFLCVMVPELSHAPAAFLALSPMERRVTYCRASGHFHSAEEIGGFLGTTGRVVRVVESRTRSKLGVAHAH